MSPSLGLQEGPRRQDVEHAGKIGKSAAARNAVDVEQLDFEQAAILAELAGDEDAEQQLLDCHWYQFRAVAEELRAERIERAAFEEAAKPYQSKGFTVLAQHPGYGTVMTMGDVRMPDGSAVTIEDVEAGAAYWSVVLSQTEYVLDKDTGAPVDEDEVEWYTREDPDVDADDGYRHFNTVRVETTWSPEYLCNDPEAAGMQLSPVMAAVRAGSGPDELTGGTLDPEDEAERQRLEKLAEAKRTELERAEKDRRERKMVRVLNVKAEAATVVRREFLRKLFAAKDATERGSRIRRDHPRRRHAPVDRIPGQCRLQGIVRHQGLVRLRVRERSGRQVQRRPRPGSHPGVGARSSGIPVGKGCLAIEAEEQRQLPRVPRGTRAHVDSGRGNHPWRQVARTGR